MIPSLRPELLQSLAEVYDLSEDVRFGQLLDFLGFLGQDMTGRPLAEIEDDELLRVIERFRTDLERRAGKPARQSA